MSDLYVHVHFTVNYDRILDVIRHANIAYWGCLKRLDECVHPTYQVIDRLDEQATPSLLTRDSVGHGIAWLTTQGFGEQVGRIVTGMADATDGDMLIQAAAFGELKYG